MAEGPQLDPWQSSYLQLKSISAMLSDIHRKIVQSREGGPRSDGIRSEAHAEPIHEANSKFGPTLENQDARVFNSSLADPNRTFKGQDIFMEFESREDQLKVVHEEASENPGASIEESTQDSLEESIRRLKDLKGLAWIKEFVRLEKLGKADEVLRYVIDNERKEEVVEESVPYTDSEREPSDRSKCVTNSEQESINRSNYAEKIEDRVKNAAACKVFDEISLRRTGANLHIEEIQTHQLGNSNKEVDVVEEFHKLVQTDDVEAYTKKFAELRTGMLSLKPSLSEFYFVTSYISELKDEIRNLVKLSRPKTLSAAYEEARMQYNALQAIISEFEEPVILDTVASEIRDGIAVESFDSLEIALDDLKVNSFECLANSSARKLFVEIPRIELLEREPVVMSPDVEFPSVTDVITSQNKLWSGKLIFDPGIPDMSLSRLSSSVLVLFSDGEQTTIMVDCHICCTYAVSTGLYDPCFVKMIGDLISTCKPESVLEIFDPGGVCGLLILRWALNSSRIDGIMRAEIANQRLQWDPGGVFCHDWVHYNSTYAAALVCICWVLEGLIFVWDPSGVVQPCLQVLMLS